MGVQLAPWAIAENVDLSDFEHPVELARNLNEALVGEKTGVFRVGDFAVTTPVSGLTVNVAGGNAMLVGGENATQGAYFVWSDATEAVSFGAPAASIRYDTILLRVADKQYGSISGNCRAYLEVVAGVAGAGAPRADSYFNTGGGGHQPGAWFRLADVQVDPGATNIAANKITHNLQYARIGGLALCTSTTRPTDMVTGDEIWETDTTLHYRYSGTEWRMASPYKRTTILGSATASVTFSSIPAAIKTLRIRATCKGDTAARFTGLQLRLNGDTGTTYDTEQLVGAGAVASAFEVLAGTSATIGETAGATAIAGSVSVHEVTFPSANNTTFWKLGMGKHTLSAQTSGGEAAWLLAKVWGIRWRSTAAINSVTLFPAAGNFITGSEFTIEGWD